MTSISSAPMAFYFGFVALLLYFAYRWALPKPIPEMPFNKKAANRILGDLPDMIAYVKANGVFFPWLTEQNVRLGSPIVQLFTRPFQKPWVILADFRESQDILLRRSHEFDRADFLLDVFQNIVPDMHSSMWTSDPKFKANKQLLRDLMTPGFLLQVAAPRIYANVEKLIDLWSLKTDLAAGHPFSATTDVYNAALDFVAAAAFDIDPNDGTTNAQIQIMSDTENLSLSPNIEQPVNFPYAPRPPRLDAIVTLTESLAAARGPFGRARHWLMRQKRYMRDARAYKEELITDALDRGLQRLSQGRSQKNCAVDFILQREHDIAKKDSRVPEYKRRAIYDELFGFIIGGHDAVSTTLLWGLKNLTDNPECQKTLRTYLRQAYSSAASERRNPSAEEIMKSHIFYFDAVIEEMLRTALTFPGSVRSALVNTTVLGYPIPKGTNVFLTQNGPGYLSPAIPIPKERRSESACNAKYSVGSWDPEDMKAFRPERWVKIEAGEKVFDPLAGPHLAFGLGHRGCFGRRLGYQNLRISLVMLLWNFEFERCPEDLSSYQAVEKLSRQPTQAFVRLRRVTW